VSGAVAGNAAGIAAALIFGGAVVATREAVQDVPPLSLAVLRFGQGALILFVVLLAGARGLLRVERRDLPFFALLGAILYAAFPVTFNAALDLTTASRGSVMLATMPIWTVVLARATGRETLSPRQLGGVALSVAGVAGVFLEGGLGFGDDTAATVGNALMLLTAVGGATYGVLAKPLFRRYAPLTITAYTMAFGTLMLAPLALVEGLPGAVADMTAKTTALVLFLGIPAGALGYFLITFTLARLTPTQTAVYINLNPMVATTLGALLLDEDITGTFAAGFAVVLTGLLLVNWPRSAPRAAPVSVSTS
jgi:drug/metabolite transporter (DMT)-like permease